MSLPAAVPASEYPFESRFVLVAGGHRMHYVDEGAGHPVVMVHGNPSWSFYYRHVIREVSQGQRAIAVDHIGCGLSDKPGDGQYEFTLRQRVEDLDRLLGEVVPEGKVSLVLHDWGGMIGMTWAVNNAERIEKIVLLNTGAFPLPNPRKRLPLPVWLARDTKVGAVLVERFNAFSRGAIRWCVTEKMAPEIARGYEAPYLAKEDRIATLRFVQDIPMSEEDQAWGVVKDTESKLGVFADEQIMIGWGHKDFVFDDHFLAKWKEIYPRAKYLEYPEAGHYVLEDRRRDLPGEIMKFLL